MKQKLLVILLVGGLLFSATPVFAIDVVVHDRALDYSSDQPPVIQNGRTLVPVRSILEAFGMTVAWAPDTRTVTCQKDNQTIQLQIDRPIATVNERQISLDVPPTILNGRTMVPIRFIAESLGARVEWLQANQTVYVDSKVPEIKVPMINPDIDFILTHSYGDIAQKYPLEEVSIKTFMALAPVPSGLGDSFPYPGFVKRIQGTDIVLGFVDSVWARERGIDQLARENKAREISEIIHQYRPSPTANVRTVSGNASDFIIQMPDNFSMTFESFAHSIGYFYGADQSGSYYDSQYHPYGGYNYCLQSEKANHSSNPAMSLVTPDTKVGIYSRYH